MCFEIELPLTTNVGYCPGGTLVVPNDQGACDGLHKGEEVRNRLALGRVRYWENEYMCSPWHHRTY